MIGTGEYGEHDPADVPPPAAAIVDELADDLDAHIDALRQLRRLIPWDSDGPAANGSALGAQLDHSIAVARALQTRLLIERPTGSAREGEP